MSLRNVDLNLLTVFDAVMREGNVTRAAASIGMSQSAMSDAVGRLRRLLNDDLFIRTGHGVRPTPRAEHFAKPIRQILNQITTTLAESHSFDFVTSTRGFNLTLGDYGELVVLPSLIQWLEGLNAQVIINARALQRGQILDQLRTGAVDLLLSSEPIPDTDYVSLPVIVEHLVSLVRHDHPVAKKSLSFDEFLAMRHILLEWPSARGSVVEQALRARGLERRRCMFVHSFLDMPRIVASTDMICTMPSRMARHFAETHKLRSFPTPEMAIEVPFYLIWHKRFEPDPGHAWIRSAIASLLEQSA